MKVKSVEALLEWLNVEVDDSLPDAATHEGNFLERHGEKQLEYTFDKDWQHKETRAVHVERYKRVRIGYGQKILYGWQKIGGL